jgi:hypothetical protein
MAGKVYAVAVLVLTTADGTSTEIVDNHPMAPTDKTGNTWTAHGDATYRSLLDVR